jgi:hypothetical protein
MLDVMTGGVLFGASTRGKAAMRAKHGFAIASGALALACAGTALAQQTVTQQEAMEAPTYMRAPLRAPNNAFEINVNTGYTQGFGDIMPGQEIGDVADAGLGIGLDLGYRATPGFSISASAQYQEFDPDNSLKSTATRGMTAGLTATWHLAPYHRVDPNLSLGTGYRLFWEVPDGPNNNLLTHGFQLVKGSLGLDVRLNDSVAIGPMVGADLTLFLWQNPEGPAGNREIDDPRVSTFVYAGLQGRFDIGGQRSAQIQEISERTQY